MAFTQDQVDKLEAAIAQGVLVVKYEDKEVTYRSLSEMTQILNRMKRSVGKKTKSPLGSRIYPSYSKGLE